MHSEVTGTSGTSLGSLGTFGINGRLGSSVLFESAVSFLCEAGNYFYVARFDSSVEFDSLDGSAV